MFIIPKVKIPIEIHIGICEKLHNEGAHNIIYVYIFSMYVLSSIVQYIFVFSIVYLLWNVRLPLGLFSYRAILK